MKNIESYNSSYPLAYYEVGSVYSFYGKTSSKGTPATTEAIKKYASVLNALLVKEPESAIKPVRDSAEIATGRGGMNRFYAVVIEKVKNGSDTHIVVMLCNKYNGHSEYYTRNYSVNYGCATDGKNLMQVASHLDFESKIIGKVGGITLVGKSERIGGVTRVNGKYTNTSSVGSITRVHQTSNRSLGDRNTTGTQIDCVTLVKKQKVGGITRVKK